jgi:predicted nucleotidyltransferase component of viral defense system
LISRADIVERVGEWGLREDVVEKDYVLGWVLAGIGADAELSDGWVFKGGTCLKKCYIETYRFSEDLDFTLLPHSSRSSEELLVAIARVLASVATTSGINFSARDPVIRFRPDESSAEARIYYVGPRQSPSAARIKFDLSFNEKVVRPPVLREIAHPYPDSLAPTNQVRCYSFEEVFGEKLRAMGERGRPRDLYDIINLFWRDDLALHPTTIREVLIEKCASKDVPVPTLDSVRAATTIGELESEWANMLGHQLPVLPPFRQFWDELTFLFEWLEGRRKAVPLVALPMGREEQAAWSPPPTISTWRSGVPLETIRFAASNRLLVELGYQGSIRLIEPYSLRRTQRGNLILHALRADSGEHRSYTVAMIESARATTRPFRPTYAIEFSSRGPMAAPPTARRAR